MPDAPDDNPTAPQPSDDALRAALRESDERFRASFEQAVIGMAQLDPQGRVLRVNDAFCRMVGRPPEELVGRDSQHYTHPDDRAVNVVHIRRVEGEHLDYSVFEKRYLRPDGTVVRAQATLSAMRDASRNVIGLIGIVEDVTERRRADERLRESEARFADIVRTAMDCIVGMDAAGRVTEWNPAAEATFGYARDEAIGREMAHLIIPPALRDRHRAGLAKYLATGVGPVIGRRVELPSIRKSGDEFPVELTIVPTTGAEGAPAFTGYVRDITDRKRAERERDALLESERAARSDAERASRMKDEFLATLSHELRTPLNAILGWSQIVRRPAATTDDVAQGLAVIERNARAQAQLIEDLLDMSRIISGKVRLDVGPLDVATLARGGVDAARPAADAKGLRLDSDGVDSSEGGLVVAGDSARLQQVLWNLLSNAVKFTPAGGVVRVSLAREDGRVELSIADTGEGIRPDFLPHVFDRFRQADASTTRRHGGLGLGLSIVRQLVELHGGAVRAHSAGPGQGSTFVVTLPLATSSTARAGDVAGHDNGQFAAEGLKTSAGHAVNDRPADAALSGVRVLVVDDEPDARSLIRRLLEDAAATVTTAGSAAEALDALARERHDVLLSDVGMPGEDGYSLLRRIRASGPTRGGDVAAVALTAFARAEDRARAFDAGFQAHLSKPVEPADLIGAVARAARAPK